MDSPYLWPQPKQAQDTVLNGLGSSSSTSGSSLRNGIEQNGHGAVQSQQWEHSYGYGNASSGSNGSQTAQQSIPQSYYEPNWNLYEDFQDLSGSIQSSGTLNTISPATILAQRAPNGSSQGQGPVMDGPTTIDPTLMMTSPFPRYIPPTQTQYLQHSQMQRPSVYQQHASYLPMSGADSSLSAEVNYRPPPQTTPTPPLSSSPLPNPSSSGSNGTSSPPLIDQVKKLLTPKQLDRDPQVSAQKLIDLLLPPSPRSNSSDANSQTPPPPATDKDTRMEILTRLRDHAPKEFFVVFARNASVLGLLREWGKNACKKEEFEETLMGWLQVVDKLPLTVEALAQSGLGKLIKYVVEHPPTTAIKDMAAKIESGWKKAIASQQDTKAEPERPKKRKLETSTATSKGASTTSGTTSSASTTPATKKAAVVNPAGVRVAVRKDSLNSPTTGTFPGTAGTTGGAPKGAQSDSGFFSAKPKAKLPSFRKKPTTSTTPTSSTTTNSASNTAEAASALTYSNPFEDAMKSLRKSSDSPALSNPAPSGNIIVSGVSTPPGISAKTGKPKKKVKFDDKELEKIRYIDRAIYDDDTPGFSGFQGQSYRDLDRAEGNLLKHMLAQIEWFEPPSINPSDLPNLAQRGERSTEAKTQAEREMSALAAFYQGAPPDTPVEPPQLAALPLNADDSSATTMLLGTRIEEEIQGGRPDTVMSAGHWLGQLGTDGLGAEYGAGMASPYGAIGQGSLPPQHSMIPGSMPAPGQEGIADILNKLMKVVGQPESGAPQPPAQPQYGAPYGAAGAAVYQQNAPPATGVDNAAIISALTALGMLPATQQPGEHGDQAGYGVEMYGNTASYGPTSAGGPYGATTSGLPPPLHNGMPGREEQEDRWRRSANGDAAINGKRGKRKDVPASQNPWKPLCTFFARGKCRFGEACDFSHDPSKLPK